LTSTTIWQRRAVGETLEKKTELIELIEIAGKEILQIKGGCEDSQNKSDGSPVTQADIASNCIITSGLRSLFPQLPIVSEEGDMESPEKSFFLVDPLDGTKEFIRGLSDFTVNIALIENQRPLMGIVHLPSTGLTYFGDRTGAWKIKGDDSMCIHVSQRVQSPRIVTSRSHLDDATKKFIESYRDAEVFQAGSSAKFCLIAEGAADIYPRFGRTMEWDTAAGQAVLEAAGGKVVNPTTGQELPYVKPGYENPGFVAVSNSSLLQK